MNIFSPAFERGHEMPALYTCDGGLPAGGVNPPLGFSEIPPGSLSLALVMDDPDAPTGTFVHWLVWNLPAASAGIAENATALGGVQGMNSYQKPGYAGPCPPMGEEHRYFFRLYALDSMLDLPAGSTHEQLNKAMGGHVLSQAEFHGVYKRLGGSAKVSVSEKMLDAEEIAIGIAIALNANVPGVSQVPPAAVYPVTEDDRESLGAPRDGDSKKPERGKSDPQVNA